MEWSYTVKETMKLYNSQEIYKKVPNTFRERKGEEEILKHRFVKKKLSVYRFLNFNIPKISEGKAPLDTFPSLVSL